MITPPLHRHLLAVLLLVACLLPPAGALAADTGNAVTYPYPPPPAPAAPAPRPAEPALANQLLTGFASFLVTPVYGAFKLTFAGLGALTGGLAWAFTGGDDRVAREIWETTMGGTYVITPDHLAGRKPVHFTGDP